MSTYDHEWLSAIFERASELEPRERDAFLDDACGDDADLRAEVESLLAHHDDLPDVLNTGEFTSPAAQPAETLPDRIGPYRILQRVGEGGMGVVYRAEQDAPLRRQVAIKQIKLGIETEQVMARFESERQALALMTHPNIARVLDAGSTPAGRPYFVMEYVDGEPITDYCDARRLRVRDRLRLFLQVCEGVQHAHHNAIIHRDIKPSNILVTEQEGRPVPKIIDFGVAKALDRRLSTPTIYTQAGQMLGTPEYMSPEQAAVDGRRTDSRTDVYSLGVLLYELIVGTHPHATTGPRGDGLDELRRRIREEQPSRPSAKAGRAGPESVDSARNRAANPRFLARRLRGDLDWITMKALEKDPARRYGSPAELAADIRRHLDHEAIIAGPPGTLYRLARFMTRNRTKVAVTAGFVVLVLGTSIAGTIQSSRIAEETERANREAATAEQVSEFLVAMFDTSPRIDSRFWRGSTDDVLQRGAARIKSGLGDQPVLKNRLLHTMGDLHRAMGFDQRTRPLLEEAHANLRELLGADHPMTLDAAASLAEHYMDRFLFDESERIYSDTLQRRRRTQGDDHPETLRAAVDLGYLYKSLGRILEAERLFRPAVEGLHRVLGRDNEEALIAAGFLAGVYLEQGRYDVAEPLLRELVERMPGVLGDTHFESLVALYNLGCVYANLGDTDRALEYVGRAIELGFSPGLFILTDRHMKPLHDDPRFAVIVQNHRLNESYFRDKEELRADIEASRGRYDEAASRYADVLEARRRLGFVDAGESGRVLHKLAEVLLIQRRFGEARALYEENLAAHRRTWGQHPPDEGDILWRVAQGYLGEGTPGQALPLMRQAIAIYEKYDPGIPPAFLYRAGMSAMTGDHEGAIRHLRTAVDRGYEWTRWMKIDLSLQPLHGEPEFEAILAEMEERYGDV